MSEEILKSIYKCTICHPDQQEIERPDILFHKYQLLDMAKKHPWAEQMKLMTALSEDDVYYNPSLEFINTEDNHSFTVTADMDQNEDLEFSLWYIRPVKVKILFGILGKTTRKKSVNKWSVSEAEAYKSLEIFLEREYEQIEKIMAG